LLDNIEVKELIDKAYENRKKLLKIMETCGSAHIGGALSAMDILTVLYNKVIKHDPRNPKWRDRDFFILSAGHKGLALYTVLQSMGYFKEETLWSYNKFNTKIPTHPDSELLPGIEFSLGSLGHGLSVAGGIALTLKREKRNNRIFVLMGDGEIAEGSVWEAIMSSVKYKLDNLVAIIDVNGLQAENSTEEAMPIAPFEDKISSFGWDVKTINGHDIKQILEVFKMVPVKKHKPLCIIANTIKSKGIDFAESNPEFHNWTPSKKEVDIAMRCLKKCQLMEVDKIGQ
jgi:transketolase